MNFSKDEKCPVCNQIFQDNDDIVICHRCGTPHHRDCYNQLGHCANYQNHNIKVDEASPEDCNNEYAEDTVINDTASVQSDNQNSCYYYNPDNSAEPDIKRCTKCGAENEKGVVFCTECGEKFDLNESEFENNNAVQMPYQSFENKQYEKSSETIDGKSIYDVACVVKSNSRRFIDKFKKNKKISWNWGAFFFGAYYYMFRKMYKEGIIIMAVDLALSLVIQGAYAEKLADFQSLMMNNFEAFANNPTNELITQFIDMYRQIFPMFAILLASTLIISICCALFADKIYRTKVLGVIDKVDEQLSEGGKFGQNPMFAVETDLSQEQMRGLYLSKLGGISIFSPLLAYMVLNLISSLISKL
ncbi:MAG: DUF2628 domain-containing protein [Acetobacter sp.]|nr:DUF2628 domain-containing protein [Bacteroides sp.]MCM1341054.1 DUF2628 domain-containing protein [Acetobacter sp.]MCM1432390.1 DUF2628 domain-containing protein [Clostridiales bacterium]